MDVLKKTLEFWKELKNNQSDHGDIFAYRLTQLLR